MRTRQKQHVATDTWRSLGCQNSSFHKKLSTSLTTDITIVHLVTRPLGPFSRSLTDYRHGWYGLRGFAWCMIWPAGHGIAWGMAWRDMAWYIISPGGHDMIYGMAWRGGMVPYNVWPGGHGMVFYKAWRDMAWYVEMLM